MSKIRINFENKEDFKDYLETERTISDAFGKAYSAMDRAILYCHYMLNWGIDKTSKRIKVDNKKISSYYVRRFIEELKQPDSGMFNKIDRGGI